MDVCGRTCAEIVKNGDCIAALQQSLCKMAAYKSGAAGYQNVHTRTGLNESPNSSAGHRHYRSGSASYCSDTFLVPKMPRTGQGHHQPQTVATCYHFLITDGAPGLYDSGNTVGSCGFDAVGERKEGV